MLLDCSVLHYAFAINQLAMTLNVLASTALQL